MGTSVCELGVLSVRCGDEWTVPGGRRATSVLALLSVDRSRVRTLDELVEAGWEGDDRPPTARQSIINVISQLRRSYGPELIETVGPGYRLGGTVESERETFVDLLPRAIAASSAEEVLGLTAQAAAVWRGVPWADLDDIDELRIDQSRLVQAWRRIRSLRAASLHDVGRLVEAQAAWAELADENPLDEDAWVGWARSLGAADRRVESLRVLDRARHVLGESGVLPGSRLRETERQLLSVRQDGVDDPGRRFHLPPAVSRRPELLVGRQNALDELEAAWRDIDRSGQMVIVEGPAGVGKSTVVAEFAHRVATRGAVVLFGAADDVLQIPFQPYVSALDHYGASTDEDKSLDLITGDRLHDDATNTNSTFQVIDHLHRVISGIVSRRCSPTRSSACPRTMSTGSSPD